MSPGIKALAASMIMAMLLGSSAWAQKKGTPDKRIETIVGVWKIEKILNGKTEVARNPTSGQWLEFRADGTYVNQATSLDSGSYRVNENHSTLYLESKVQAPSGDNAAKIVEWNIALEDNKLSMHQKPAAADKKSHADKMQYVYVRIEKGSNKLNN